MASHPAKSVADCRVAKVKCVNIFTRRLLQLTTALSTSYRLDDKLRRAANLISLAINEWPVWIIESVGFYLSRYGAQILRRDAGFFLQEDFSADIRVDANRDRASYTEHIIRVLKSHAQALTPADQKPYWDMLTEMVNIYDEYIECLILLGEPLPAAVVPVGGPAIASKRT